MLIVLEWDLGSRVVCDLATEYVTWTSTLHFSIYKGCLRVVMVKMLKCGIVVSNFELQSHHYVHFRTNTLGKCMALVSFQLWVKYYCSSRRMALALNILQTLKKETKPNQNFAFTGQHGRSERPDLVNRLVSSIPSTAPIIRRNFYKLLLFHPYFILKVLKANG